MDAGALPKSADSGSESGMTQGWGQNGEGITLHEDSGSSPE